MSNPMTDLAEAFPRLLSTVIIITGLLNLSFNLDATIPITPSCQFFPLTIITGSDRVLFASIEIFSKLMLSLFAHSSASSKLFCEV